MKQEGIDWGSWVKAFLLPMLGFVAIFSVARADIGNLKDRVSKLEALPDTVSRMSANIEAFQQQQTEMRQDIKALLQRGR